MDAPTETPLRERIFTHPRELRFLRWYRRTFSLGEFEQEPLLPWAFGALLLAYFVSFFDYVSSSAITVEAYRANLYSCWSYFPSCGEYYFLSALPFGYSQSYLYAGFFALMTLIVYLMWRREWVLAQLAFLPLFIWKLQVIFLWSASLGGNYDYYDLAFSIVLLFLPYKLFFLKVTFVFLYFLATTIKIHEGWILGTYFTSLRTGLPIFPDALTPVVTNTVILMQMIGAWFLLSKNHLYQRAALTFFLCFHLYSSILVHFRYITTAIPMLLILFGPRYSVTPVPLTKRALPGFTLLACLLAFQMIPFTIPGDQKLTLEGNRFGLYMFEANHQCRSETTVHLTDGTTETATTWSSTARLRCDPYKYWFTLQERCQRHPNIERISWTFDHSINGNPFYRIVDTQDACALTYKTFEHNEWIRLPEAGARAVGLPVENVYY